jgi:hypothetical protein
VEFRSELGPVYLGAKTIAVDEIKGLSSKNLNFFFLGTGFELRASHLLGRRSKKCLHFAKCQWLTPVILVTEEAEIRRIKVQGQSGQIVLETLY